MAKAVERVNEVIIRFAGDSGDGMQLTGARFTSETAVLGNDLSTLPDFPAEIRAPAGSLPGVSGLPDPLRRPRHPHAGRPAERARRDEPGGAEDERQGPAEGRHADRQLRRVQRQEPRQGRLRDEPARGRLARRVPGARDPADVDDARGGQGVRRHEREADRCEEHVRARADVVALHAPDRGDDRRDPRRSSPSGRRSPRRTSSAFQAGYAFGETTEGFAVQYEVAPAQDDAGRLPQHHGQPGARARPRRRGREERAAALPRRVPDHARVGDPRGARRLQALRRPHVPGRGRDRRCRRGARRVLRRLARRHAPRAAPGSCSSRRRSASRSRSSSRS